MTVRNDGHQKRKESGGADEWVKEQNIFSTSVNVAVVVEKSENRFADSSELRTWVKGVFYWSLSKLVFILDS